MTEELKELNLDVGHRRVSRLMRQNAKYTGCESRTMHSIQLASVNAFDAEYTKTRDEARQDVFDYIEMFYNPKRKHANNGLLPPVESMGSETNGT